MGFIPITLPGTTGIKLALDFDTSTLYYNISGEYAPVSITSGQVLEFINANKEVIYVDEMPELGGTNNAIYVDGWGQTKFWNALDNEWILISKSISDIISEDTISNKEIPTTQAVYDFVNSVSHPSVQFVDELTSLDKPDSFVILDYEQLYAVSETSGHIPLSIGVEDTISIDATNDTVPGTKAVYDYVQTNKGVKYQEEIPVTGNSDSLYIGEDGQIKYWNESDWIDVSTPIVTEITENNIGEEVPTTEAVYNFVKSEEKDPVTFVSDLPVSGVANSFVILDSDQLYATNENNENIPLSIGVEDTISMYSTNETVPGAKAVYNLFKTVSNIDMEIISITAENNTFNINMDQNKIYKIKLTDSGYTININSDELPNNFVVTSEVWIEMSGDIYEFSMPNITWIYEPYFDTANTLYAVVLRWDGEKIIGNVAYTLEVS